jgi:uncharacterized membrane protein YtjA (UPF0391 family)
VALVYSPEPSLRPSGGYGLHQTAKQNPPMLNYAIIFLIIAILAGVLGFGVVAGTAATIAKVLFVVFLVLFLFSLFTGRRRL